MIMINKNQPLEKPDLTEEHEPPKQEVKWNVIWTAVLLAITVTSLAVFLQYLNSAP